MIDLYRPIRAIVGIATHAGDLFYQGDGRIVALAENGVTTVQMWIGNFGDKKLRAVGIRTGIGVRQPSGTVELQRRRSFIFELEADVTAARAGRIATLNHKFRNHTVKNGSVIERNSVLFCVRDWVRPVFGALGQANKVGNANRGFVGKRVQVSLPAVVSMTSGWAGCRGRHSGGSGCGWFVGRRGLGGWRRLGRTYRSQAGNQQASQETESHGSSLHGLLLSRVAPGLGGRDTHPA